MKRAEEKTKEELLIDERSKGKSLRQLGQMFNTSHERVRQLLAKYDRSQVTLLAEQKVAADLGYPVGWLVQLRKEGIIKPIKPGGFWLYSEEQVKQIPVLIAEVRKCSSVVSCARAGPEGYAGSVANIGKDRGTWHGEKHKDDKGLSDH